MDHPGILLANAVVLGVRHGIDWDHIAAIMDIAGTTSAESEVGLPLHRPLVLSSMYALGHACVVAALGMAALSFATILPVWIDPLMERLVGFTLLLLGAWVCFSLIRHAQGKEDFRLQSRWMLLLTLIDSGKDRLWSRFTGRKMSNSLTVREYGFRTAFGIGMIHGIGAETGTQVLLIAAIGGAASHGLGAAMLMAFIAGLLISNTLVAVLSTTSFASARRIESLYITAGAITCIFSFVIGAYFALGQGQRLPDLKHFFGAA